MSLVVKWLILRHAEKAHSKVVVSVQTWCHKQPFANQYRWRQQRNRFVNLWKLWLFHIFKFRKTIISTKEKVYIWICWNYCRNCTTSATAALPSCLLPYPTTRSSTTRTMSTSKVSSVSGCWTRSSVTLTRWAVVSWVIAELSLSYL